MYPHTVTIYRHSSKNGEDAYQKYILPGVYWYGSFGVSAAKNGFEQAAGITVELPKAHADTFGVSWFAEPGDLCVLGTGPDIGRQRDLDGFTKMTIQSIQVNRCGSALDNISFAGV